MVSFGDLFGLTWPSSRNYEGWPSSLSVKKPGHEEAVQCKAPTRTFSMCCGLSVESCPLHVDGACETVTVDAHSVLPANPFETSLWEDMECSATQMREHLSWSLGSSKNGTPADTFRASPQKRSCASEPGTIYSCQDGPGFRQCRFDVAFAARLEETESLPRSPLAGRLLAIREGSTHSWCAALGLPEHCNEEVCDEQAPVIASRSQQALAQARSDRDGLQLDPKPYDVKFQESLGIHSPAGSSTTCPDSIELQTRESVERDLQHLPGVQRLHPTSPPSPASDASTDSDLHRSWCIEDSHRDLLTHEANIQQRSEVGFFSMSLDHLQTKGIELSREDCECDFRDSADGEALELPCKKSQAARRDSGRPKEVSKRRVIDPTDPQTWPANMKLRVFEEGFIPFAAVIAAGDGSTADHIDFDADHRGISIARSTFVEASTMACRGGA